MATLTTQRSTKAGWAAALIVLLIGMLVVPAPTAAAVDTVVHRINVGGPAVAAADGSSPGWSADNSASPSPLRVAGSNNTYGLGSGSAYAGPIDMSDASVPASAPAQVFETERWDNPGGSEMTWAFPVTVGATYQVRLLFAELYSGIDTVGERVFDVSVEGTVPTEFSGIDQFAQAGPAGAMARTVEVTATDATLDLVFVHVAQNPALKGIEIIEGGADPGVLTASPVDLDFGSVIEGASSAPQTVTLSNPGGAGDPAITLDSVTLATGTEFSAGAPSATLVGPGESATLDVTYAPTAAGAHSDTVTVAFSSSAGAGTVDVALSGTGVAATPIEDALTASPASVSFADTLVDGGSSMETVQFANAGAVGEGDVTITGITISDAQFAAGALPSGAIPPGGTASVDLTFDPSAEGAQAGTATVDYSRGAETGSLVVPLSGAGVTAPPPGDTVVYRINVGGPAVAAADGSSPGWSADNSASPSPLRVAGSNNTYALGAGSAYAGPIDMSDASVPASAPAQVFETERWDNSGGSEMTWAFPVTVGATYQVRLLFAELYSGIKQAGQRVFDVSVEGTVPAEFSGIDQFAQAGPVGAMARTVEVTATDATLDLVFVHVAQNPALKGIEIIEVGSTGGGGVLAASPVDVAFGSVIVGAASAPQAVTLSNTGGAGDPVITIDSVTLASGAEFSAGAPSATLVGPGESATVDVAFAPTVAGAHTDTLTVAYSSSAGAGTVDVALSGTGVAATPIEDALTASPASVTFADTLVDGGSSTETVQFSNAGAAGEGDVTITGITITDAQFTPGALPSAIAPGGTASVDFTFDPSAEGAQATTATVDYERGGETASLTVPLAGAGVSTPPPGDTVVYRINVGGPAVAAADGSSPGWSADTSASPSPLRVAGSNNLYGLGSGGAYAGPIVMSDPSVPASAPAQVFATERYDIAGGAEMTWAFPVTVGSTYQVRLLFAELYSGVNAAGKRVFDVSVEGTVPAAFSGIDQFAQAGAAGAMARTVEVTALDTSLDLVFVHVTENPALKGIEIIEAGSAPGVLVASSSDVDLGSAVVGGTASATVDFVNAGGAGDPVITIDSATVASGAEFSAGAPSTTQVGPGEVVSIPVNYAPTAAGAHTDTLTVAYSSSAGAGTVDVALSGTGVAATPIEDALAASPASVTFPNTLVDGGSNSTTVQFSNAGAAGEGGVTITGITIPDAQFTAGALPSGAIQPGSSAGVVFTFDPSSVASHSTTATVDYERGGETASLTVPLAGVGVTDLSIDELAWHQSQLGGEVSQSATTLDWGPDGRLYVGQFDGTIYAYTVTRDQGSDYTVAGTYTVTASEQINLVKQIPNHDDQGTAQPGKTNRLILGLTVEGTAANPVIYATSNHPDINAGTSIDTNSGALSRLTWTGSAWEHTVLVAGLPRSQHDHMLGGVQLDAGANMLYMNTGGNTNQGARSNNMDQLPEYALSNAVLSIDLGAIDAMPTQAIAGVNYKYLLPTIESGVSPGPGYTPWGGKAGANMAMLIQGSPVQIHSTGYRNAYDLVLTENGNFFTVDNGPNGGWGHAPSASYVNGDITGAGDADLTNGKCVDSSFASGGSTKPDQLHRANAGDYNGHPNVTRANPLGLPDGVYNFGDAIPGAWYQDPRECEYLPAGLDGALTTFGSSTNGITEFTAATVFDGVLQGALLTASYTGSGVIWAMVPSADGLSLTTEKVQLFSGFGAYPLDVVAQGDDEEFPGLVAAVAYQAAASIVFWEPAGGVACDPSDPAADSDGDGYTNGDEVASGTSPCNNGSRPTDWDGDFIGDVTDPDDDNDGLDDVIDPFQVDANNGVGVSDIQLTFDATVNEGGFEGAGLTGLMLNATGKGAGAGDDYLNLLNRTDVIWGGTSPLIQINEVKEGDAFAAGNDQEDGLQVGFDAGTAPFRVETTIAAPSFASTDPALAGAAQNYASQGVFIGDGTQSNYLRFALAYDGGIVIQALKEVNDVVVALDQPPAPEAVDAQYVGLILDVTPGATEATVVPSYTVDGGAPVALPAMTVPMSWFDGPSYLEPGDPASTLAVGIIATSRGPADPFDAAWTDLFVTETAPPPPPPGPAARARVEVTPGGALNTSTYGTNTLQLTNESDPGVLLTSVEFDLSTAIVPDLVFDPTDGSSAGDLTDVCFVPNTGASATGLTTQLIAGQNCGPDAPQPLADAFLAPYQDGFRVLRLEFDDFDEGDDGSGSYAFGFQVDIDPTSIKGSGSPGPGESGSVSGLELVGSTVTMEFSNGETHVATLFSDGSAGGAVAVAKAGSAGAPTITVQGPGAGPADVADPVQTVTLTGPDGAAYELLRVEGAMFEPSGGGFDIDPYEINTVVGVEVLTGTITGGSVDVPVTLTNSVAEGGYNYLVAVIRDADGDTGGASSVIALRLL